MLSENVTIKKSQEKIEFCENSHYTLMESKYEENKPDYNIFRLNLILYDKRKTGKTLKESCLSPITMKIKELTKQTLTKCKQTKISANDYKILEDQFKRIDSICEPYF